MWLFYSAAEALTVFPLVTVATGQGDLRGALAETVCSVCSATAMRTHVLGARVRCPTAITLSGTRRGKGIRHARN